MSTVKVSRHCVMHVIQRQTAVIWIRVMFTSHATAVTGDFSSGFKPLEMELRLLTTNGEKESVPSFMNTMHGHCKYCINNCKPKHSCQKLHVKNCPIGLSLFLPSLFLCQDLHTLSKDTKQLNLSERKSNDDQNHNNHSAKQQPFISTCLNILLSSHQIKGVLSCWDKKKDNSNTMYVLLS